MQPSSLLRTILSSPNRGDMSTLDQQVNLLLVLFFFLLFNLYTFLLNSNWMSITLPSATTSAIAFSPWWKKLPIFSLVLHNKRYWCLLFHSFFPWKSFKFVFSKFSSVAIYVVLLRFFFFIIAFRKSCCACALTWKHTWSVTSERVRNVFTGPGSVTMKTETFRITLSVICFLVLFCGVFCTVKVNHALQQTT